MDTLHTRLPELPPFVKSLAAQVEDGTLCDWKGFAEQVRGFFTPQMMEKAEHVLPGWGAMASYADGLTLVHVTAVLTALYLLPQYKEAAPEQQMTMEWMVLFHDIGKVAQRGKRDHIHAFRSAAIAAKALARMFSISADQWAALTHNAVMELDGETVQDNIKLPEILSCIDHLFGHHTPAAHIIKGTLLHLSLPNDPDYPIPTPLTAAEIRQYIDPQLFPLLKMMFLVDTDSWNLFDSATRHHKHTQTLAYFATLTP